tara:strand:+ start:23832 stop:25916 length:2085 start_codon:yes stop_codon:yes gene_type:complete
MEELHAIVSDLESRDTVRLVVFRSGKESGFLAGADVSAIADIDSPDQATDLLIQGQDLFARIERLPMPTLAVIHGPCLGGGLEWSLACTYRIARDNSSTQIGLPEIKLGLIPGWGGTQRLPRLVGLPESLTMILQGKHRSAKDAARIGLVDRSIDPSMWETEVDAFIQDILDHPESARSRPRQSWRHWLMNSTRIGRGLVFRQARKKIRNKSKQYPALSSAIRAIASGYSSRVDGFAVERIEFAKLISTPTCRRLLELFFARERARNVKTWSPETGVAMHDDPIRKIGVIGGGAMGAGIAQLSALRGFDVAIKEIDERSAMMAKERIDGLIDELSARKRFSAQQRDEIRGRIFVSTDQSRFADADLIIEAVVEREDVKCAVFTEMDHTVKDGAILATNTSSLSVDRMAEVVKRPAEMAGLHFFNPVHRMELVEVVRGRKTSDATVAKLVSLVRALGKTPVVTSDSPGFLVNRVLFPYLGEAVVMIREGYDVSIIDRELKKFGMPMGPCELLDQVGLDVALHVAKSLAKTLVDVEPVVQQLTKMVDDGRLGVKSGEGFYHYIGGKRTEPSIVSDSTSAVCNFEDFVTDGLTNIQRRLVYPMLSEAIRCYEERVVEHPWAIDLAMVLGTGFAPHQGGPLHMVDAIGHPRVLQNLCRLRSICGNRFAPPKSLFASSDRGRTFFGADQEQSQIDPVRT